MSSKTPLPNAPKRIAPRSILAAARRTAAPVAAPIAATQVAVAVEPVAPPAVAAPEPAPVEANNAGAGKRPRFVRGERVRPAAKPDAAPLPARSTKAVGRMMTLGVVLPPKGLSSSGPPPQPFAGRRVADHDRV